LGIYEERKRETAVKKKLQIPSSGKPTNENIRKEGGGPSISYRIKNPASGETFLGRAMFTL